MPMPWPRFEESDHMCHSPPMPESACAAQFQKSASPSHCAPARFLVKADATDATMYVLCAFRPPPARLPQPNRTALSSTDRSEAASAIALTRRLLRIQTTADSWYTCRHDERAGVNERSAADYGSVGAGQTIYPQEFAAGSGAVSRVRYDQQAQRSYHTRCWHRSD